MTAVAVTRVDLRNMICWQSFFYRSEVWELSGLVLHEASTSNHGCVPKLTGLHVESEGILASPSLWGIEWRLQKPPAPNAQFPTGKLDIDMFLGQPGHQPCAPPSVWAQSAWREFPVRLACARQKWQGQFVRASLSICHASQSSTRFLFISLLFIAFDVWMCVCVLAWVEERHDALSRELGTVRQEARRNHLQILFRDNMAIHLHYWRKAQKSCFGENYGRFLRVTTSHHQAHHITTSHPMMDPRSFCNLAKSASSTERLRFFRFGQDVGGGVQLVSKDKGYK